MSLTRVCVVDACGGLNVRRSTLGAVRDSDARTVLHHCDETGDLEFFCCFLVFILCLEGEDNFKKDPISYHIHCFPCSAHVDAVQFLSRLTVTTKG